MWFTKYRERLLSEPRSRAFWRDVLAEFVSTFFLVSVQAALPLSWGTDMLGGPVQVSLGMGFIVCTMAWTLGDFGGAHMNPAVSIVMALRLDITITRAVLYIIVQCCGSLAGAGFIYVLTPADHRGRLAVTSLGPGVTPLQGTFLEAWITCIMVITILGSVNQRRKGNVYMATIPIGFAVTLGIMAAFMSTGASMNPARSLGPAVMMGLWEHHWVYWVGPILGSCVAGLVYSLFDKVDINQVSKKHTVERTVTKAVEEKSSLNNNGSVPTVQSEINHSYL